MEAPKLLGTVLADSGVDRRRVIGMLGGLALLTACGSDQASDSAAGGPPATDLAGVTLVRSHDCSGTDPADESMQVVRRGLEAMAAGDLDAVQELLSESVALHAVSPTGEVGATFGGLSEVAALLQKVAVDPKQAFPLNGGIIVTAKEGPCKEGSPIAAFVEVVGGVVERISTATLPPEVAGR